MNDQAGQSQPLPAQGVEVPRQLLADYQAEYEGPVPDYTLRRKYREQLFACLTAAPPSDKAASSDVDLSRALSEQHTGTAVVECHGLDTPDRVCFYEQDFYVLSNFSSFSLMWMGFKFDTSEAVYHWEKFPHDTALRASIRLASSAHEAFKAAERHREKRRPDWDRVKVNIMRDILREKVRQHEYVRRKLLATGDRELVENSWRDDFWGWGPNRDGQNMLGKLWMEIRAELRTTPAAPRNGAPITRSSDEQNGAAVEALRERIDALYAKATPGPWDSGEPDYFGDYSIMPPTPTGAVAAVVTNGRPPREVFANAALITALVNAWPAISKALSSPVHQTNSEAHSRGNNSDRA